MPENINEKNENYQQRRWPDERSWPFDSYAASSQDLRPVAGTPYHEATLELTIKKNNHYVWAHYLRGWSSNGRDIYYRTRKGNIALDSTIGLARDRGFYRLTPLTEEDFSFIELWIKISPPPVQHLHCKFLETLKLHAVAHQVLVEPSDENLIAAIQYNLIEDFYSGIERKAKPALDALRRGDFEALASEQVLQRFIICMGHQLSRTMSFREDVRLISTSVKKNFNALLEKNSLVIGIITGTNLGYKIASEYQRKNIVWLQNKTDLSFITSDNPVINVHPDVIDTKLGDDPPDSTDLYYPLSPTLAYMVNDSPFYGVGFVDATLDVVETLNRNVLLRSNQTVFGDSQEAIQSTKLPKELRCSG